MAEGLINQDELIDRCFSRPVASAIVAVVRPTPVTPNMLTFVAACFGVAAGVFLALQEGVWAAVMVFAYLAFDCSDGQLARSRGGGGLMGRIADGLGDYVAATAIHIGLVIWLADGYGWIVAFPVTVGAGFSMGWTSLLLDRYKQRYRGTPDDFDAIDEAVQGASWFERAMIRTFRSYASRVDGGVVIPDLAAYQQRVRFPMRLWLWVGPTTHFATLAICAVLDTPLSYAFIACVPMNLWGDITMLIQRRLERRRPAVVQEGGDESA